MAEKVFEALARESSLESLHIAGGEPTLRMDLLVRIIVMARQQNLPVAYVETNASWCRDLPTAQRGFARLREAGLPAILISVSMFHNEFVPLAFTRNAIQAAREVFGPQNVILYLPHMYELLSRLPDDGTHSLEQFCRWTGLEGREEVIPRLYDVIPSGRAVKALRDCFFPRPARAYAGQTCRTNLLNTSHFHIDSQGNLFTGLCAGIVPASVDNLHPPISPETHPVFTLLCEAGPFGLMEMATKRYSYEPREDGFVSKCDLCLAVRSFLATKGPFLELRPASYYAE
jgi:hypothetical protein